MTCTMVELVVCATILKRNEFVWTQIILDSLLECNSTTMTFHLGSHKRIEGMADRSNKHVAMLVMAPHFVVSKTVTLYNWLSWCSVTCVIIECAIECLEQRAASAQDLKIWQVLAENQLDLKVMCINTWQWEAWRSAYIVSEEGND